MKKLVLFTLALTLVTTTLQAQGQFRAGADLALPIGDAGDVSTFGIALDLAYILEIDDNFSAGPIAGYQHFFGDEISGGGFSISISDVQFLPIGGMAQYNFSDQFSGRASLGYAIGVSDGNDGGFYYSPAVGYNITETIAILLAYRGIAVDGGTWDAIALGVEFGIN